MTESAVPAPGFSVVVPTVGRPSLAPLLAALERGGGPRPDAVVVVDDRRAPATPLAVALGPRLGPRVHVVPGPARGPAAARNVGWRATASPWVAFLDDDVLPPPEWAARLADDLAGLPAVVAGSQGRIRVPLPADRRPTDAERGTAGLEVARWATADMAYRRSALDRVGGFDERFPRAYREDADLALRVLGAGGRLVRGMRTVDHPPRPAPAWASVRAQAGNADDVRMGRLHGPDWRVRAGAPAGRLRRHAAVTAGGAAALLGLAWFAGLAAAGRRGGAALGVGGPAAGRSAAAGRFGGAGSPVGPAAGRPTVRGSAGGPGGRVARGIAAAGLGGWVIGTAELAWARIAPGPRTPREVVTMLATSAAIPPAAVWHTMCGLAERRPAPWSAPGLAVLFDRDGTLIRDVPYNADPDKVEPMPGALAALTLLRGRGVPVGVVTNQSAVARGLVTVDDVHRMHARVEELLGPFGTWQFCPHGPDDGCGCRKPEPGMVRAAASALGLPPERCVVVGDIGADVGAARAAGARAVLVPTPATRAGEVADAHRQPGCLVAPDLLTAVRLVLAELPAPAGGPR